MFGGQHTLDPGQSHGLPSASPLRFVATVCAVPAGLAYLVIEKIPNVDPDNPHPVYFVKATIPHLEVGQTSSKDFVLKEPIGTKAEFWVISVDNGGCEPSAKIRWWIRNIVLAVRNYSRVATLLAYEKLEVAFPARISQRPGSG
jgi:hypothetical protein